MIDSFVESSAFRDHPIASIVVRGRLKEIIYINKAAKKLFGERKSSWMLKEVTEFLPGINFKLKNSKLDFTGEGKPETVWVSSSKLKFTDASYYLVAVTQAPENLDFDHKPHAVKKNEKKCKGKGHFQYDHQQFARCFFIFSR